MSELQKKIEEMRGMPTPIDIEPEIKEELVPKVKVPAHKEKIYHEELKEIRETGIPTLEYPEVEKLREEKERLLIPKFKTPGIVEQVKQTPMGNEFVSTLSEVKTVKLIGKIDKAIKDLIKYSREQFSKGNYPSENKYKEWIKTATPDELLGPTPFAPKTSEEAIARAKFASSQGLIGAFKEATFPFSWGKYKPMNIYETSAQLGGALLTPTPQDYIIGKLIGKAIGKVEDFASAINEYRLTKKLGKGWELIPDEVGDAWFRIGEGYGLDIPEQAVKDLLRAHKKGQYVPPTKMDEWVAKHIYSAGAGYYPFPELVNIPKEGLTSDPRLLAELIRLRDLTKLPVKELKETFIGGLGSITLAIDILNKEKSDLRESGYPSDYIEQRREQINTTVEKLRDLEDTLTITKPEEIIDVIEETTIDITPIPIPAPPEPIPIEITETILEPKMVIEPIIEPIPITELLPKEPVPLEKPTIMVPLSKREKEELKKIRLQLYMGSKERYRVRYTYPRGKGETLTVEARGFPDAVQKAQRVRRSNKYLPSVVDVVRIQ